jgi:hypothetical protein
MSYNFQTKDLIVFVPAEMCPHPILDAINQQCYVKKEDDEPSDVIIGVINIHMFKYTDFSAITNYVSRPEVMIIALQSAGFSTEIEYSDKLNEIVGAKKYTVLSISELHKVPTEQSATALRTRMIRSNNAVESINGLLGGWFREKEEGSWHVKSRIAQHCCSMTITVKTVV